MTNLAIELGPIFPELDQGLLVLTPNHRTSVQLLEAYGEYRKQKRLPLVCTSPNIFPVDIWVRQCWDELSNQINSPVKSRLILNTSQELLLWQELIRHSSVGSKLFNQQATARSAQGAYRLLLQWKIPLQELHLFSTSAFLESAPYEDVEVFVQWLADYEKRLIQENFLNLTQLLPEFIDALLAGYIKLPKKVLLLGFDTPPPLYQQLFDAIEKNKCILSLQTLQPFEPEIEIRAYNNKLQEMLNAAQWAKTLIDKNKDVKVGIICPDLHSRSEEVHRVFLHQFYPQSILFKYDSIPTSFSTTASSPLSSIAVIETIFSLLALNEQSLPTLDICQLLRSSYIEGANEEADTRAALELLLRKKSESQFSLADLRFLCSQEDKPWYSPILSKALTDISSLHKRNQSKRSTAQWIIFIEQHLNYIGWPGKDDFSASEIQTLKLWQELLKDFNELGCICANINFHTALRLLQQLAFNAPSMHFFNQAPVQILTPIEAAGLQFTHLWFMGISEHDWPLASRPNPFIPIKIQKKYHIPDASADLQYQSARTTLYNFSNATRDSLVFSYPLLAEDIPLKPSMILEEFSSSNVNLVNSTDVPQEQLNISNLHPLSYSLLSTSVDNNVTEVLQDKVNILLAETESPSGGTRLIADQADCPFKNFSLQRLKAQELPNPGFGLPLYEVGNMLHYAMELMWQQLKSQDSIKQLNSAQQKQLTSTAANTAVSATAIRFKQTMTAEYTRLEKERLSSLLLLWLEEEIKRDFFTVVEHEYSIQWQHSNLNLNLRIDRIEQFEDNSFGVVDYKSSTSNTSINWLDPRQDKPQLLLYLLAAEQTGTLPQISSLLYAQVNIEDMKFKGLTSNLTNYPGLAFEKQKRLSENMSWNELKLFWQNSIANIAQEFLDGYMAITPKKSSSCQYCHLASFCRIQEVRKAQ